MAQAQHPSSLLYSSVPCAHTSDMDHTASFDPGRGGDSGQNNKQRKFKGYESDAQSLGSELVPMQSYRREFSRRQSYS